MNPKNHPKKHGASPLRTVFGNRKKLAVIALIAICCCIAGVGTLTHLFVESEALENTFTPADVSCQVLETFDGETKSDVRIKNTGKASAYIRAAVVVNWKSANGTSVTAQMPVEGTDYEILFGSDGWELANDGFRYYTLPVSVGDETAILIESCTCTGTPPDGFYLSVEIVASAIQSSPASVVADYWDSGISGVNDNVLQVIQ